MYAWHGLGRVLAHSAQPSVEDGGTPWVGGRESDPGQTEMGTTASDVALPRGDGDAAGQIWLLGTSSVRAQFVSSAESKRGADIVGTGAMRE